MKLLHLLHPAGILPFLVEKVAGGFCLGIKLILVYVIKEVAIVEGKLNLRQRELLKLPHLVKDLGGTHLEVVIVHEEGHTEAKERQIEQELVHHVELLQIGSLCFLTLIFVEDIS